MRRRTTPKVFVLAPPPVTANTFVGLVTNTIATPDDFISYFGLGLYMTASDISFFEVIGNDLALKIEVDYDGIAVSSNNFNLKYYVDKDGKCTKINNVAFIVSGNDQNFKFAYFPGALNVSAGIGNPRCFLRRRRMTVLYVGNATQLGTPTSTSEFLQTGQDEAGSKIFVDPTQATINSGAPDATITSNAIYTDFVYCTDKVNFPAQIIDLSITSITATTCVLNFTPPSSVNSLFKYEVWNNKKQFLGWVTASGQTLSGLITGTNYNLTLIASDEYYNLSGHSNNQNFTTL